MDFELLNLNWQRSSFCGTGACVEVIRDGDIVVVRDGKFGDHSVQQTFSAKRWQELIAALAGGRDYPDVLDVDDHVYLGRVVPLCFTAEEWTAFVKGVKSGEFGLDRLSTPAPDPARQVPEGAVPVGTGSGLAATGADKEESVSGGTAPVAAPSGPATFRKKPVEIQAMQWTSDDVAYDITDWAGGSVTYDPYASGPSDPETGGDWGRLEIETLEGPLVATPRDWIIRGVKGEFYPRKPDIFAATYEVVPEPAWGSGPLVDHGGTP